MAIKGISDRKELPRFAKIRTGIKKTNSKGKEYPEEVPYFVLNPIDEIRDKAGEVIGKEENPHIKELIALFGEKPNVLRIAFPVDDLSMVADPFMKWWTGNVSKRKATLACKGDGEYARYTGTARVSGLDGDIPEHLRASGINRICNKDHCPQAKDGSCKPNMNLRFIIPEYSMYGTFQLDTTSSQAMVSILSSIDVATNALRLEGINSIAGVPLRLFRVRTPNSHGGVNYIIKIEVDIALLKEEKLKLASHLPTQLAIGLENYRITNVVDEPNYDLLPQSEHGAYQSGDELIEENLQIENSVKEINREDWLHNEDLITLFNQVSEKKNQVATPARMKATAEKYSTQEELIVYLKSLL